MNRYLPLIDRKNIRFLITAIGSFALPKYPTSGSPEAFELRCLDFDEAMDQRTARTWHIGVLRQDRTQVRKTDAEKLEQGFYPCYSKDMAKVTSKYQVTVPKAIADEFKIRPGDEIEWVAAGDVIRVIPPGKGPVPEDQESRLRLFDQATERLRRRPARRQNKRSRDRGWRREDLYTRGRSR